MELCNPVTKSAVEAPRETTATITESSPVGTESLLCYQAKTASRASWPDAATLSGLAVGDKLKQAKHEKLEGVSTAPGNLLPAPTAVDTRKGEMLCVPTQVTAITVLP